MSAQPLARSRPAENAERLREIVRWKRGHHVFHVYLTAMNSLLEDCLGLLAGREWQSLEAELDELTNLYDASTAGMRYAADFAPDDYTEVVRPSMEPPFLSPGFSGVMNREHREMLSGVRCLRAAIRREPAGVPRPVGDAWTRLEDAQRRNRASHEFVCRRFVPDGVSLLRGFHRERRRLEQARGEESGDGDGARAVAPSARASA